MMNNEELRRPSAAVRLLESTYTALPIDPTFFIRKIGFKVKKDPSLKAVRLEARLDADKKEIQFDPDLSDAQRRIQTARELGRWYAKQLPEELSAGAVETYAAAFASELLMPEKAFRKAWFDGQTVEEMAGQFAVTVQAVDYRLHQIGIL